MIYVSIDIAKLNHFVSVISSDGEILMEPFQFSNDADGFHMLVSRLNSLESNNNIISLESTAHYDNNLVRYLVFSYFKCVLNPIKTSSLRKTMYVKRRRIRSKLTLLLKLMFLWTKLSEVKSYHLYMIAGTDKFLRIYYRRRQELLQFTAKLGENQF